MSPVVLSLVLQLVAAPACDTLVVCPRQLQPAMVAWLDYRARQGHAIELVDGGDSAEAIRVRIRQAAKGQRLRFIVLVGDAPTARDAERQTARPTLPTHYEPARVIARWDNNPWIATDNWYADLDDDNLPDVAIGRITSSSQQELSLILGKVLAYEQSKDFGPWRRQVNLVAGLGGFGALADAAIETATKKLITDGVPAGYATSMTYASLTSAYCPDPQRFSETTSRRLSEGCLFWVYMGHGQSHALDWLSVPSGRRYPILSQRDFEAINCSRGAPIACFLSCYAGAFDTNDCLAEQMLRTSGAPVAVVCGSRVTMPYAMAVLGTELLEACFARHVATLGEAVLEAKRNMARAKKSENRLALDALATLLSPAPGDLAAERSEHVQIFNLLGDPCLRLSYGQAVELSPPKSSGNSVIVEGTSPLDGVCTVELVARRDRLSFAPPSRGRYDGSSTQRAELDATYERANNARYSQRQARVKRGGFRLQLPVPEGASGASHVRVYIESGEDFALGSADVLLEHPAREGRRSLQNAAAE